MMRGIRSKKLLHKHDAFVNRVGEDVALFAVRCTHHEKTEVSKFMKFHLLSRSILNMFLVCCSHLLRKTVSRTL